MITAIKQLISRIFNPAPKLITQETKKMAVLPNTTMQGQHASTTGNYTTLTGTPYYANLTSNGPQAGTYVTGIAGNSSWVSTSGIVSNGYNIASSVSPSVMSLHNPSNKEIVRLNNDGSVTWNDSINIDEAATAFASSIQLGAELMAGVTYGVRQRIRDAVFEELIDMANNKGTLSVDDLTYLHQAAKIMDKLKGIKG
jgi:hypothetical protein